MNSMAGTLHKSTDWLDARHQPVLSEMQRPRILIQSGSYELENLGEQAMIRSAIGRIRDRLPGAVFAVVARNCDALRALAPDAECVPVENKGEWKVVRSLYLAIRKRFPAADPFLRAHLRQFFHSLLRLKARQLINRDILGKTDFMIVSGGGYFNDVFAAQAWSSLERIRAADSLGIPFAIVGLGLGPLADPALRGAAKELFPRARIIGVRDREASPRLLRELGVSDVNVFVTGDDAVEDAWRGRAADIGNGIGVNLRVAPYAGTSVEHIAAIREGLITAVAATRGVLIPLPICIAESAESSSDFDVAQDVISGVAGARRNTVAPPSVSDLTALVSTCRVVITGSYHCAVFALSQGIPAVCIHNSEYYLTKFQGLKDLFGSGCRLISMSSDSFSRTLATVTLETWNDAPSLRPALIVAAEKQIDAGRRAYATLSSIIATETQDSRRARRESAA